MWASGRVAGRGAGKAPAGAGAGAGDERAVSWRVQRGLGGSGRGWGGERGEGVSKHLYCKHYGGGAGVEGEGRETFATSAL